MVAAKWYSRMAGFDLILSKVRPGEERFEQVRLLRKAAYRLDSLGLTCSIDDYSHVYLLSRGNVPVGTIRVTDALAGPMECQEHFPEVLRTDHAAKTGSASRFCLWPGGAPPFAARLLAEHAWADALDREIRCDVIDVSRRAVTYYQKLGYKTVPGRSFRHPVLGTSSVVMVAVASPGFQGSLAWLLGQIAETECLQRLLSDLAEIPSSHHH